MNESEIYQGGKKSFVVSPIALSTGSLVFDGNTLDKCISNKTHNKNIKNTHAVRTITNPGVHSPPSNVAWSRDARTAYAITKYEIANLPYPNSKSFHGYLYSKYINKSYIKCLLKSSKKLKKLKTIEGKKKLIKKVGK